MQTCEHCGVEKHGIVFKTECDRRNGTTSTPDFVRTRICRKHNHAGCLNKEGSIKPELDYQNFGIKTEDWIEVAKDLMPKVLI